MQTLSVHSIRNSALQRRRIDRSRVTRPVQSCNGSEVQTMRSSKQHLEMIAVHCLRKKRENSAAIIVENHDRCIELMEPRGQQSIHVVIEREIANDQHQRSISDCCGAECGGDDAVNSIGSAIGENNYVAII